MKPFIFISVLLVVTSLSSGCAHTRSTVSSHSSRLEAYLATLHAGMTPADAERELHRWGCVPIGTIGLAASHPHSYIFIPDGATVMLQYDDNDRLISWAGAEGNRTVPNNATNVSDYQNDIIVSETPSDTDTQLQIPLGLWKRQIAVNYPSTMKLTVTCRVYRNGVLDKAISSRQILGTTLPVGTQYFELGMIDPDAINPDKPQGKVKIFGVVGPLWINKAPQWSSSGCEINVPTMGKIESGKEYLVMEFRYGTAILIGGSATYVPTNAEFSATLHIRADPLSSQEQQILHRQSNFSETFKVDD